MSVLDGYDSDEEFSFNPCEDIDWNPTEPILKGSKPLRQDYRLLEGIGRGSYSRVYKVENIHTGDICCAKNYFPQKDPNGGFLDLSTHALSELSMLCSLSHKSILPVYGIYRGRRRSSVYLVTELFDYTLDELIHFQAPLTESEIKTILHTILDVLSFIHSKHIFHCDLKPGNILCKKGRIALCDWGSATHSNTPSQPPTLGYRAPELLLWKESMDSSYWSPAVDVWSWGILVVELLTQRYLIESDSELATLNSFAKMAGTEQMSEEERKQLDDCNEHSLLRFGSIRGSVEALVPNASPALLAVLRDCFHFMPAGRKSAEELLRSEWMQGCGEQEDLRDWSQWVREKREEKKKKTWEMWQELQRMLMENQ